MFFLQLFPVHQATSTWRGRGIRLRWRQEDGTESAWCGHPHRKL